MDECVIVVNTSDAVEFKERCSVHVKAGYVFVSATTPVNGYGHSIYVAVLVKYPAPEPIVCPSCGYRDGFHHLGCMGG